jgi:hydrogenase 3 maturation protease
MLNLRQNLSKFLSDSSSLAVLGVGSELRSDDVSGMLVAELLQIYADKNDKNMKVFMGATAPENLTGEIKKYEPSHLIIIDTAEMKKKPGEVMILSKENVNNFSFSTHKLPIKVMIDYLMQSQSMHVAIIGIQPKSIEFGLPPSQEIKEVAEKIAEMIIDIMEGRK